MNNLSAQNITLEDVDREIVKKFAEPRGLSFSAAIRMIIREWRSLKYNDLTPAQQVVEELRGEMS